MARTGSPIRLSRDAVAEWPSALLAAGAQVLAPMATAEGDIEYRMLTSESGHVRGLGSGLPRLSPKSAWFPRTEPILEMTRSDRRWDLRDPAFCFPQVVAFGARPCDAAAPEILRPLFGWDVADPFFTARREHLAFVVLACQQPVDAACFCTSVGVDPAGETIGDVTLTEMPDGSFAAEANTETGRRLLSAFPDTSPVDTPNELLAQRNRVRQAIPQRFDPVNVQAALNRRFDDPLWERASRSCIACGTCAFACPTCHCFDIQDEMVGDKGLRQKNWDACAFPRFTVHASGHNPRKNQASRWRQRLAHKFATYPEKFKKILCTGCGRCLRLCPAGMDLLADLTLLAHTPHAPPPIPTVSAIAREGAGAVPGIQANLPDRSLNIYRPYLMRIAEARDETPDVRTLRLEFTQSEDAAGFDFRVGQFGLYSALGEGEATFCIASSPTRKGYLECTFRQAGRVTRALRRLEPGDLVGFRGPYGTSFPVEDWRGKNLLFIAGGIALPPMRSVIQYCLDNRADYGDITILYGARTRSDHVYKDELVEWEQRSDIALWLCIDWKANESGLIEAEAEAGWRPLSLQDPMSTVLDADHRRYTGFVPQLVEAAKPSPTRCLAVLCGPPVMITYTMASLKKLGFDDQNVFTTLENRMKCGLGKCGRCNVGPIYVCKEGPVFTAQQVGALPPDL